MIKIITLEKYNKDLYLRSRILKENKEAINTRVEIKVKNFFINESNFSFLDKIILNLNEENIDAIIFYNPRLTEVYYKIILEIYKESKLPSMIVSKSNEISIGGAHEFYRKKISEKALIFKRLGMSKSDCFTYLRTMKGKNLVPDALKFKKLITNSSVGISFYERMDKLEEKLSLIPIKESSIMVWDVENISIENLTEIHNRLGFKVEKSFFIFSTRLGQKQSNILYPYKNSFGLKV